MNFNLNFSFDLVNLALGKSNVSTKLSSKGGFEDLLASLDMDIENTNVDQENEDCDLIASLIQNLFSNLNKLKEMDNSYVNPDLKKEEILKSINDTILSINDKSNLNLKTLDIDKMMKLSNDEISSYIDLNFNLDKFTKTDDLDLPTDGEVILPKGLNLDKLSKKAGEKNTKLAENINEQDENPKDGIKKVDSEIKSLKSYEELNIATNANKNNIVDVNQKDKGKDEGLSILENIADKNGSDLSIINNKTFIQEPAINKNPPAVTIRASNIGDDFIKMVKYLKNNNIEEIKVNINPKELGDMTIKLLKDSEATKVFIHVGKEETFNMLNKNVNDINRHLSDLGIKAKDIVVEMKSNDQNFFSDNLSQEFSRKEEQKKQKRNSRSNRTTVNSIEDIDEEKIDESNLNILA
ncbi:flagellar hook-length control FliK family protein [[Clostridium] bifermentans ATCC 638]|uniref:Flagellar hook-length control FliK family protein n=1 Tax=Paraclostridium bifermentans ATCC 638 = DSM 14991 TaxID=1233171 RepID=T4VS97_PARBF|nr:flagellar hook-length control protein FliK [Paraclostridium bifermentans]EQK43621.1 flagellar hook-length control FliK family protein [[Clostridium] bifermentans ATCC 638] [Paraclostridium bifermentans ATCC 638 = DSM 14991]RIZ59673.1 flagellar hook-length control protein FliK [Paraclostridium bifermentans]UAG17465.1 flagellar hook-length control protein FliK [Paraclostridium bifermentans]